MFGRDGVIKGTNILLLHTIVFEVSTIVECLKSLRSENQTPRFHLFNRSITQFSFMSH